MSNIRQLFSVVADMSVTFEKEIGALKSGGTVTVTGTDLSDLKTKWERPDLPTRIILPMEEYNAVSPGVAEMMSAGAGSPGEMLWNLVDLFLWKEVGQGKNLSDHLPNLVNYTGKYIEKILSNVQPVKHMVLNSVSPSIGVFEFPVASQRQFYGVECQLTYSEIINPGG